MTSELKSIEEYINSFPEHTRSILTKIRMIIKNLAPDAVENISYGIPSYKYNNKPLVYFAAFKTHIGFYATPSGHSAFEHELSKYKQGKGSVQFPIDAPIPYPLIKKIVKFRLAESRKKKD